METLILESNVNTSNDLTQKVKDAANQSVGIAKNYEEASAFLPDAKQLELVIVNTHFPPFGGFDIASRFADRNNKVEFLFYVTGEPHRIELSIASQFPQTAAIVSGHDDEFAAALRSIKQTSPKSLFLSQTVRPFFLDQHGQPCVDKNGRPTVWMVEQLRSLTPLRFKTLIQRAQGLSNGDIAEANNRSVKAVSGLLSKISKQLFIPVKELQNFVYSEGLMNPLPYDAHCAFCPDCNRSTFLSSREVYAANLNQSVTLNCSKCKQNWKASLSEIRRISDDENQAEDAA